MRLLLVRDTKQRAKRHFGSIIVVLLFLIFVGIGPIVFGFLGIKQQKEAQAFKETEAVVLSIGIEQRRTSSGGSTKTSSITYLPKITYRYTVKEVEYTNDKYDTLNSSKSEDWAKSVINKYNVGQKCAAYYSPSNPSQSILTKDVSLLLPSIFISFGGLFTILGVYLMVRVLK